MNTPRCWSRPATRALVLGTLAILFAAPAFARQPDGWVTTKVKAYLVVSPKVGGIPIDVDTDDGRVTLHGKVGTARERDEAARLAAGVGGVRSVRNLLQVVPESRRPEVGLADERLKQRIVEALEAEPRLAGSHIDVKSVNRGVVLLVGRAESLTDRLLAVEVAGLVKGVRRVASQIDSPELLGDRPGRDARLAQARSAFGDAWNTGRTRLAFLMDPDVPADLRVETRRGVVTLFGTVPDAGVKARAQQIAGAGSGVVAVRNELVVAARGEKRRTAGSDRAARSAIRTRLRDAGLGGAAIHVDVQAGVARLAGTVKRPVDRYEAVAIAHTTRGVELVLDDLRVTTG